MQLSKYFIFAFLAILTTLASAEHCNPHRLRIGPDLYYRDYDEIGLAPPAKSHEFGWLYGVNIGYDFVKPNNVYFGSDINLTFGRTVYDGSLQNLQTFVITPFESRTNNFFLDAEGRCGYTFRTDSKTTISPFIGLGYHCWYRGAVPDNPYGYDEFYDWPYLSLGFRTEYCLSKKLSLGINYKNMFMFYGQMKSSNLNDVTFILGNKIHYEIEFPITYHLNCNKKFFTSVMLTPYFRNRNIGRSNVVSQDFLDLGLLQFVEPESTTYVFGARLEFVHEF